MQDTSATGPQLHAGAMTRARTPARSGNLAKPLTLAAMSLGYGVVQLDVTIVNTALQQHRLLAGRWRVGTAMGGQRLHHRVCRLHSHRRRARRSHRRQAGFHGGLCHLHGGLARLRAGAELP